MPFSKLKIQEPCIVAPPTGRMDKGWQASYLYTAFAFDMLIVRVCVCVCVCVCMCIHSGTVRPGWKHWVWSCRNTTPGHQEWSLRPHICGKGMCVQLHACRSKCRGPVLLSHEYYDRAWRINALHVSVHVICWYVLCACIHAPHNSPHRHLDKEAGKGGN